MRKPFQGVWNIVRFNWHFFVVVLILLIALIFIGTQLNTAYYSYCYLIGILLILPTAVSLLVSFYVYDWSNLYEFKWMQQLALPDVPRLVNINAGFDETSHLIAQKFPAAQLSVFDFYNPEQHTEVSIKRARKAYPPYPNTQSISTNQVPLEHQTTDAIFAILSAHEIRDTNERIAFFSALTHSLKNDGQIIITEHLRDLPNFLAYNIGFFHFHSKATWLQTFEAANLTVAQTIPNTPFITTFILKKNGASS